MKINKFSVAYEMKIDKKIYFSIKIRKQFMKEELFRIIKI